MSAQIHGGEGNDTLVIDPQGGAANTSLMMKNWTSNVSGIEVVDITGDADDARSMFISGDDVFKITGTNNGVLWVNGDQNDEIYLQQPVSGAGWNEGVTETVNGHQYIHFTYSSPVFTVHLMMDYDMYN